LRACVSQDAQADISYQLLPIHLRPYLPYRRRVLPSNEGRAIAEAHSPAASRYAKLIGINKPILYKLTGPWWTRCGRPTRALATAGTTWKGGAARGGTVRGTLDSGLALLNESVAKLRPRTGHDTREVLFSFTILRISADLVADMAGTCISNGRRRLSPRHAGTARKRGLPGPVRARRRSGRYTRRSPQASRNRFSSAIVCSKGPRRYCHHQGGQKITRLMTATR